VVEGLSPEEEYARSLLFVASLAYFLLGVQ
jgi:hypothetical protein